MKVLDVIHGGFGSAQHHMQCDAHLLHELASRAKPLMHHYAWNGPCLTFGYFLKPELLLDPSAVQKWGVQTARRPTGGGLLFHVSDLAFSLLLPASHARFNQNTKQSYAWVNRIVMQALEQFLGIQNESMSLAPCLIEDSNRSFCMAHPTIYDVMMGGKKVGGAAQRRTRAGFLHQGSLYLTLPPERLVQEVLLDGPAVWGAMQKMSSPLLGQDCGVKELEVARVGLRVALSEAFQEALQA